MTRKGWQRNPYCGEKERRGGIEKGKRSETKEKKGGGRGSTFLKYRKKKKIHKKKHLLVFLVEFFCFRKGNFSEIKFKRKVDQPKLVSGLWTSRAGRINNIGKRSNTTRKGADVGSHTVDRVGSVSGAAHRQQQHVLARGLLKRQSDRYAIQARHMRCQSRKEREPRPLEGPALRNRQSKASPFSAGGEITKKKEYAGYRKQIVSCFW